MPKSAQASCGLKRFSRRGMKILEIRVPEFDEAAAIHGGISPRGPAVHRAWIDRSGISIRACQAYPTRRGSPRRRLHQLLRVARPVRSFTRANYDVDVLGMPTVPRSAPPIEDLEREAETYRRVNRLMLRNTNPINFLDGCALTLPVHAPGDAPVGLMVAGFSGEDERVLSVGLALEGAVQYTSP
jgi:aspartyl-tRNA(Asn)/glutamyl-tRNA(Gln) amidotransferase subunit A